MLRKLTLKEVISEVRRIGVDNAIARLEAIASPVRPVSTCIRRMDSGADKNWCLVIGPKVEPGLLTTAYGKDVAPSIHYGKDIEEAVAVATIALVSPTCAVENLDHPTVRIIKPRQERS